MKRLLVLAGLVLCALASVASAQTVYRWTDAQG